MSGGIGNIGRNIGQGALNGAVQGLAASFSPGGVDTITPGATKVDRSKIREAEIADAAETELDAKANIESTTRKGAAQRSMLRVQGAERDSTNMTNASIAQNDGVMTKFAQNAGKQLS